MTVLEKSANLNIVKVLNSIQSCECCFEKNSLEVLTEGLIYLGFFQEKLYYRASEHDENGYFRLVIIDQSNTKENIVSDYVFLIHQTAIKTIDWYSVNFIDNTRDNGIKCFILNSTIANSIIGVQDAIDYIYIDENYIDNCTIWDSTIMYKKIEKVSFVDNDLIL